MNTKKIQILGSINADTLDNFHASDFASAIDMTELQSLVGNTTVSSQINSAVSNKVDKVSGKDLSTNDYTTTEKNKLLGIESGANKTVVDTELSSTSTNPVQNKIIDATLSNKAEIAMLATFTPTGQTATAITGVSDKTHSEVFAAVNSGRQVYAYIPSMNNTCIPVTSCSENVANFGGVIGYSGPKSVKAELIGTAVTVVMYPMTPPVTQSDSGKVVTVSSDGQLILSTNAPSNAEVNQNAFSNVKVGDKTIAADSKTDTLILAGSNVTVTPDVTNDKVTIGITKENITNALGYTPPTTNTTYSDATQSTHGLLSTTDKKKLDGIEEGANKYTLTTAGSSLGGVKTGGDVTITDGVITVNDDSHSHTIENVDNLQTSLDSKFSKTGGQVSGDLALYAASGNSPSLVFQRGTLTDNYNDWRIQDRSGYLYFDQRGTGSTDWASMVTFSQSDVSFEKPVKSTRFDGPATKLTTTTAGTATKPVYFSNGIPVACSVEIPTDAHINSLIDTKLGVIENGSY